MSHLRAVGGTEPPDNDFAERARAMLERALSEHPTAMMIAYETANAIERVSIPNSVALQRGLVDILSDALRATVDGE